MNNEMMCMLINNVTCGNVEDTFEKEMCWNELYEECEKILTIVARSNNFEFDSLWELSDFVQEVMISVCDKIQTYNLNRGKVATWIKMLGKNVYYDYKRSIRNKVKELPMYFENDNNEEINIVDKVKLGTSVEDAYIYNITSDKIYDIINNLRPSYRDVVTLHYIEGFEPMEISKMLRIKRDDVYGRLSRGRKKLKDIFLREKIEEDLSYEYEL